MTGSSLMGLATRPEMADGQLFEIGRRTFDTPHFRGIEFIEVESKTILNKVAGNYLPFNWSINVFRGCSHACPFVLRGPRTPTSTSTQGATSKPRSS